MSVAGNRGDAEGQLAGALARQVGYTTGAYGLPRIVSILDFFVDRPSAYREEVVAFLREGSPAGDDYLSEIIPFATALRLVEIVSPREAKLQRLAATELGRSLLGAKASGDVAFYNFSLCRSVLIADADYLLPVLEFIAGGEESVGVQPYFQAFQADLRARRLSWLKAAFPDRVLFERVAEHVPWLKRAKTRTSEFAADALTLNTARHHTTPRQGWLEELGLVTKSPRRPTLFGRQVLASLTPSGRFFWLGPPRDVLEQLRIAPQNLPGGPFEDDLTFTDAPLAPSAEEELSLINDLAVMLVRAFGAAKLIHAAQAPLQIAVDYVNFRSFADGRSYIWEDILNRMFQSKRNEIERFSAHTGNIGFYRLRS